MSSGVSAPLSCYHFSAPSTNKRSIGGLCKFRIPYPSPPSQDVNGQSSFPTIIRRAEIPMPFPRNLSRRPSEGLLYKMRLLFISPVQKDGMILSASSNKSKFKTQNQAFTRVRRCKCFQFNVSGKDWCLGGPKFTGNESR